MTRTNGENKRFQIYFDTEDHQYIPFDTTKERLPVLALEPWLQYVGGADTDDETDGLIKRHKLERGSQETEGLGLS